MSKENDQESTAYSEGYIQGWNDALKKLKDILLNKEEKE